MGSKGKYIYMAKDDDGNTLFEGRLGFMAEMLDTHPSHIRNLAVDKKRVEFNGIHVTIARRTDE